MNAKGARIRLCDAASEKLLTIDQLCLSDTLVMMLDRSTNVFDISFPNSKVDIEVSDKVGLHTIILMVDRIGRVDCKIEAYRGMGMWEELAYEENLTVSDARCFVIEHRDKFIT